MTQIINQLLGIESLLSQRLGSAGVTITALPVVEADAVPVMRISIEGQDELPVFVTASPTQILCICYLWTEAEVRPTRHVEMLEAMMDLNIAIPLSNFGRIGEHYVIYGALAADSRLEDIVTEVVTLADNAVEALEVFTQYLI